MSESATTRVGRRLATSYRISVCAQVLADERGLDGFTMEELAESAGVSRRTLFNYFPGKLDAVLGDFRELSEEALAQFHARGAGSNLVVDLRDLANDLLKGPELRREDVLRFRRVLHANPRLLPVAHDRFVVLTGHIVEQIRIREGAAFDAHRAQVAIRLLCALFDSAFEIFLDDPEERPIATAYDDVLRAARQLLV